MTAALREEVSRVRLFAHMLVIGRKKRRGKETAPELPFLLGGLPRKAAFCCDPAVPLSHLTCLNKQGNNKGYVKEGQLILLAQLQKLALFHDSVS